VKKTKEDNKKVEKVDQIINLTSTSRLKNDKISAQ
jgi:hypothetical protein